jgi:two-component system, cell cycle sensor histidine kinase and response regulator CckA
MASAHNHMFGARGRKVDLSHNGGQYSLLFAANPTPMWVFDIETLQFLEVNEAAVAKYGFSRDEFLGMTIADIRAPEDASAVSAYLKAPAADFHRNGVSRHSRKDSTPLTVEVTAQDIVFKERRARLVVAQDVGEYERSAAELQKKQEVLQSILDDMPAVVFVQDLEGRFTLVNTAWEQFTGLLRDQAAGRTVHDIFPPDVADGLRSGDRAMLDAGVPTEAELVLPGADGQRTYITSRFPLRNKEGRIEGLVGLAVDITQRKRAEDSLQRANAFAESVIQAANVMFVHLDAAGLVQKINAAAEEITGYKSAELEGASWFLLVPRDRYPYVWEEFERLMREGVTAGSFENPILTKQGDERQIMWRNTTLREGDRIVGIIAFGMDVTDRRRAEGQQARLSRVVEQATESIMITDAQGTVTYVNPAFESISGYSQAEVIGQNPRILKSGHQDAAFYRRMWETLARGEVWKGRLVNRRKDGTLFQEDATIGPVRDGSGRLVNFVAVKRDVTTEMRLERQLIQAQKMEAVGRLAGGVAHDFNNLLGVIVGYGEITRRKLGDDDSLAGKVDHILKAAERAAGLTRQLLAFSRQQILQPKIVDLNMIVADVEKMLRRLIGEDIELTTSLDPALGSVKADPGQIDQVLMNLAVNARDAMPDGGPLTIETRNAELGPEDAARRPPILAGRYVMLAVTDSGIGMDAETQSHLFEPFFTTKEMGKGTGLGLATVYGIVKQSEGYIWCDSEVGIGTTFKIYLPRVDEEAEPVHKPIAVRLARGTETVLLIEDDESLRNVVCEILEGAGYTVLVADEGAKALRIAAEYTGAIHLIVTDVIMPGLNGRKAAERIKAARSEVEILFISGYTSDAIAKHGVLEAGAKFLNKPFTTEDLLRRVRDVLDDR